MMNFKTAALGATAMAAALGGGQAFAQAAATTAAAAGGIEEVVVTARKRTEVLRNVPVQATAISAERIERQDLTSIEKIAASTPQLTVGRASNGSGARLTMRGIGSSPTSIGIEQSVAVIVDGVYYGQGRVINEGFFDLERVEVLRGPQALFFGKNATAGVISITTANPTAQFEGKARLAYEVESKQTTGEVEVSGPLSETLTARLAVRASKMKDGYFENRAVALTDTRLDVATGLRNVLVQPAPSTVNVPAAREAVARLTLEYKPTDNLRVVLKASQTWSDTKGGGYNNVIYNCVNGVSWLNPAVRCGRDFVIYSNNMPVELAATIPFAGRGELYNTYRSSAITGEVSYDLDKVDLSLVTNYQTNRNTWATAGDSQSSATPTFATENSTWEAYSAEFRALTRFDGPLNGLLGLYYQTSNRDFDQWVAFPGLANSAAAKPENRYLGFSKNSQTDGETLSPYVQLIWKPMERVEVTAGARYTRETKDSYFVHPYVNPALAGVYVPGAVAAASQKFTNTSPEATVTWRITDDVTVYGAYKTAYKSGGFSNSGIFSRFGSADDFTFDPEKAKGFEAGLKSRLFDGQVRLNIGVYDYKYTDLQVDYFNSVIFAFSTVNAGSSRTKGIEIEGEWSPAAIEGLNLHGSLNYNDAQYEDFLAPCYTGQTPAAGCRFNTAGAALFDPAGVALSGPPTPVGARQQLAGTTTAIAPEWTSTLGFEYSMAISGALRLTLSADGRYSSDYLGSSFGNPRSNQRSYTTLDARAALSSDDRGWEISLVGKNLTNEFYITSSGDGPSTGSGTGTAAGRGADQLGLAATPRTVSIEARLRF